MPKKDTHKELIYTSDEEITLETIDGSGYSEALKISNVSNFKGKDLDIYGGYEDCVDIIRGSNHTLENCVFHCDNSQQGFTIKAGVSDITIKNCVFKGSPSIGYIVLGQYSDYDFCKEIKTRRINVVNCTFENEYVHPIISWNSEDINTDARIYKINPIVKSFFFTFRKLYDKVFYGKNGRNEACLKM